MVKHVYRYKNISNRRNLIKRFKRSYKPGISRYKLGKQNALRNQNKVAKRFVNYQGGYGTFYRTQRVPYRKKGMKKTRTRTYSWYPNLLKR